jgi:hypothetical protein
MPERPRYDTAINAEPTTNMRTVCSTWVYDWPGLTARLVPINRCLW